EKLSKAYADKGVLFYMLDSNLGDNREAVAAAAQKAGWTIPILMDERQLGREQLGVQREGEVFVVDTKGWKIAYHGPVSGAKAGVDSVLAGQPAMQNVAVTAGQAIAFPERGKQAE